MEHKKLDRRVRKTKAQLWQGLMTLMEHKDIKDISVKELSDLVDINRGTFYLHYKDVYDMLNQIEDELFRKFNDILDRNLTDSTDSSSYPVLKDIFTFLNDNRTTAMAMMGPHGDLSFINRLKTLVKSRIMHIWSQQEQPYANFEYYYSFMVSGCIGLIEVWINKDEKSAEPPAEIARLASEMIERGLSR